MIHQHIPKLTVSNELKLKEKSLIIEVELRDGTPVDVTLKDYCQFAAYYGIVPSDCKDVDEFNEKMMIFRI